MDHAKKSSSCCGGLGCGSGGIGRRQFMAATAAGAAALGGGLPALAETPEQAHAKLIPAKKNLDPAWVRSLLERGEPTVYRKNESRYIGMPVGGLCAGMLYLGGDGRLWLWQIFNRHTHGVANRGEAGQDYIRPTKPLLPLQQGFALVTTTGGKSRISPLDNRGFAEIAFKGQYPIATVDYSDPKSPTSVRLEAFSPFIPLATEDSSYPATVMRYTIKNTGEEDVDAELAGWLENAVLLHSKKPTAGTRENKIYQRRWISTLECSATGEEIEERSDFGTMGLSLLGEAPGISAIASTGGGRPPRGLFEALRGQAKPATASAKFDEAKPIGALGRRFALKPGEEQTVTFLVTWNFPNLSLPQVWDFIEGAPKAIQTQNHYATRFKNARAVAQDLGSKFDALYKQTTLWRDTWYDASLPHWFMERVAANASTLASMTVHRMADGRFYGWEGIGCCPGTCTHVWHYAQTVGRLFPDLERSLREQVDYADPAFVEESGAVKFRGEFRDAALSDHVESGLLPYDFAVDGQAGVILRTCREHQTSTNDAFLQRVWPKAKKAIEFLVSIDIDGDGILDGEQPNTLDGIWYGRISWLSSLYLAALRAGEEMAKEMGDDAFATKLRTIYEKGAQNILELYNGEFFIQKPHPDPAKRWVGSYEGCLIDQVIGQSWAHQVHLGRLYSEPHIRSALESLWKYNFAPDIGPYKRIHPEGRPFVVPGDAGLMMCTWPKSKEDHGLPDGQKDEGEDGTAGYFSECMTGFEYQVAGHMIWEGMLTEGMAICRAIHDRYLAPNRNPYNEIECSDHYARAMAVHGVFLAACGYEYHGPKGYLAFSPRFRPEEFRAPFTVAEGWGTFWQTRLEGRQLEHLELKWGKLMLKELAFDLVEGHKAKGVQVSLAGKASGANFKQAGRRVHVVLKEAVVLEAGESFEIKIT